MRLLIDYLEEAARYIRERKEAVRILEDRYRRAYDLDLKKEIVDEKRKIARKRSEINYELLLNLDEFRCLKKYFPELLGAFLEDEDIGPVLGKKSWLLDYKPLPPDFAVEKLRQLKGWRSQVKEIRVMLRGRIGAIDTRFLLDHYPFLQGYLRGKMAKDDIEKSLGEIDRTLLREGWLVLITDNLIGIPAAKFMAKISKFSIEEAKISAEFARMRGRGSVAEVSTLRRLEKAKREKEHYENILAQLLLANPNYLRGLKSSKQWLSKKGTNPLQRFAMTITPHTVKEMTWLREMKERLKKSGG